MTKRERQLEHAQKEFAEIIQSAKSPIRKAKAIKTVIKNQKVNGIVIWKGPSQLDNKTPIVTIAHVRPGMNDKIGKMIQIYYLVDTKRSPLEIAQSGEDYAICGDCKHRPANLGSCYVTLFQGVRALAKAYNQNHYLDLSDNFLVTLELMRLFWEQDNYPIRFGAYGDPAAMPYDLQYKLAESVDFKHTGYTHQWQDFGDKFNEFKTLLHASVDTPEETIQAKKKNWNYYKISTCDGALTNTANVDYDKALSELRLIKQSNEMICPYTASKGKKMTCAKCLKCSGDFGKPVLNAIHGARTKTFQAEHPD